MRMMITGIGIPISQSKIPFPIYTPPRKADGLCRDAIDLNPTR